MPTPWKKNQPPPSRYSRLEQTNTFRHDGLARWQRATVGIAGCGQLGSRFAREAVLSGAQVRIYDFELGSEENLGTQLVEPNVPKVVSTVAACDAIRPGRAAGRQTDIRHVGIAELAELDMLVDCTDDPALVMPLTHISNGLCLPLLRLAVDGSGEAEFGRVAFFHGGEQPGGTRHACPLCAYDLEQVLKSTRRTSCDEWATRPDPTLAGGAVAMMITGLGLLQAQRAITGNDTHLVFNREILVDADHWQLLPLERRATADCLSGHVRWTLARLPRGATHTTFCDVFSAAAERLGPADLSVEPYAHPLATEAICTCAARRNAVGTPWADPPSCPACKKNMRFFRETQRHRIDQRTINELNIAETPLATLGLPAGAMFVARTPGRRPARLVLPCRSKCPPHEQGGEGTPRKASFRE